MKKSIPFALLTTFFLSVMVPAQCQPQMVCIVESQATTDAAQIAVQIPENSPITKIRLDSENTGKSLTKDVSAAKSFFLPVELADGENSFNIVAYTGSKIVFSTQNPIVITRKNPAPDNTTVNPKRQRLVQPSDSSPSGNIKLFGRGEIKNQAAYNLQIDASSMPPQIGDYIIEIVNEEKAGAEKITDYEIRQIVQDVKANRQKSIQTEEINLREGVNTIIVFPKIGGQELRNFAAVAKEIKCNNCLDKSGGDATGQSVNIRSIIGFEQVGASSAGSKQSPFLNFFFNTPINLAKYKFFNFSVWGDVRLTTTPVQSIAALSDFTTLNFATNFVQGGENANKVNDLVLSFNFLVGVEKEIIGQSGTFQSFLPAKTSVSLIAAGGAINPLSSDKGAVFYKIPRVNNNADIDPRFLEAFPEAAGKTNVAFVTPERDRFFRQYYAGFRLKTFFYDKEQQRNLFPAMFDVMLGQNEAITNSLQGVILRLDGSTPFPVKNTDFLYLFGSVQMKLGKTVNQTIPSFFLEPAPNTVTLTNADTIAIPINRSPFLRSNRDVFRIGVGVDLFKLFKKDDKP